VAIHEISNSTYEFNADALSIMIYGEPGSGKSYFMGTMPDVYIVSLDHGLLGLTLAGKKFDGCEVDTLDELNQVVDEILNGKRGKNAGAFALDHLTEVTELGINKAKLREVSGNMKRSKWGEIADHARMIVRKFVDIASVRKVPICVAAHARLEKNELSGNVLGLPDTVGALRATVGGFFDMYLYAKQELEWDAGVQVPKWTVSSVNHLEFGAKDRTGTLNVVEPNDYPTLYARVKERVEALKAGENNA
jgi:hypothetical protein